jgi:hypothetical protein
MASGECLKIDTEYIGLVCYRQNGKIRALQMLNCPSGNRPYLLLDALYNWPAMQ